MRPYFLLAILLVLVSGCSGRKAATGDSASFAGRLGAAKAISSTAKRDSALSTLAVEAAKAGEGDISRQSVASISSSSVKDDAGYNAATALARAGKTEDAKAVADLISSSARKDKAMAKIAEGG